MSVRTRIVEVAKAVGKFRRDLREALSGGAVGSWSAGPNDDPELAGYTRLTDRVLGYGFRRDLDKVSMQQMLRIAHYLYTSNALARWIIDVRVDMVVGAELSYTLDFDAAKLNIAPEEAKALAEQARQYLDRWWDHPAHSFHTKAAEYASTYLLTGELLLNIPDGQVNEVTGAFTLDYIDNEAIDSVLPLNALATTPGVVRVRRPGSDPLPLTVMAPDAQGRWNGQCFFFRHARRLNALRGVSDLLAVADWLDLLDQFWFSANDRALLVNNLVHHITIKNVTDDTKLTQEASKFKKATEKPGGTYVTNENISYEQIAPELQASEQVALADGLLVRILGSFSLPKHWFSEGGDANRATAGEQTSAALQALQALQTELRRVIETPLLVAYDRLRERQQIFPDRQKGAVRLSVNMPVLSTKDVSRLAAAFSQLESALSSAVDGSRVSSRTARRVLAGTLDSMGFAVDPDEEDARIEAEAEDKEERDAELANVRAALALAQAANAPEQPHEAPEAEVEPEQQRDAD